MPMNNKKDNTIISIKIYKRVVYFQKNKRYKDKGACMILTHNQSCCVCVCACMHIHAHACYLCAAEMCLRALRHFSMVSRTDAYVTFSCRRSPSPALYIIKLKERKNERDFERVFGWQQLYRCRLYSTVWASYVWCVCVCMYVCIISLHLLRHWLACVYVRSRVCMRVCTLPLPRAREE